MSNSLKTPVPDDDPRQWQWGQDDPAKTHMRVHRALDGEDRKMQLPRGYPDQNYVTCLPCIVVHWQKAGVGKKAAREGVIIPAQSIAARHIESRTGGGKACAYQADTIHSSRRAASI
jgi:hypothetical protein